MSDRTTLLRVFNLQKGEGILVLLPIIYSFFTGAALAFFVTSATSLFLSSFEREMLPLSFIAAGIFVLIVGGLYSKFQKKFEFSKVLTVGHSFLMISVIALLLIFKMSETVIVIFVLYAWIRIFTYLQAVTFWGMAGRLFTLRQAKRVFGIITFGEVVALILSFFSVPFILKIINTEQILYISGVALILSFFVLLYIVRRFKHRLSQKSKKNKIEETDTQKKGKGIVFLKNKYYKLFFLIAFIPVFAQFFVDFIFQAQAKVEFPDKAALTAFVGLFFGVSSIVEFILKVFLSGRLMSKYGVRFGLLAFPVMLIISFILASVAGLFYGTVSLFFSFVSLGRLFTRAIRTAFNDPATQILYQPLPKEERLAFQNKIESGPKAFASIFAGIILYAFTMISGFNLIYFSLFLVLVILIWLKVGVDIYKEYKLIIQDVLATKGYQSVSKISVITELLKKKIMFSAGEVQSSLIRFYHNIFPFRKEDNKENGVIGTEKLKFDEIIDMVDSENPHKRRISAELLSDYKIYKVEKSMKKLMYDQDFEVRNQAIISAGKIKERELFPYLLTNFRMPEYQEISYRTMINIGNLILPNLARFFYKLEYEPKIQLKIIDIFEKTGGDKATVFLKKIFNYPNNEIRDKVITALVNLKYKANKREVSLIGQKLEDEVRNFVYSAASLIDLEQFPDDEDIIKSVKLEMDEKRRKIFTLLSIIYDSTAMQLISENLESNEIEAAGFALEIADTVLSEIHKEMLLPVFESKSHFELVRRYKYNFPQERLSVADRLIDIINSGLVTNGVYTKAVAVNMLSRFDEKQVIRTLKSGIIHPSKIIRETAAIIMYEINKDLFFEQSDIFLHKSGDFKELTEKVQGVGKAGNLMILEKLKLIKSLDIFSSIPENDLADIAEDSVEIVFKPGNNLIIDKSNKANLYIVVSGILSDELTGEEIQQGAILSIYNKKGSKEDKIVFKTEEVSMLITTKLYYLNNLFTQNKEFAEKYLEYFK